MALAEVGARSTITSITDGSTEANYCNLYYEPTRLHALRAACWNFADRTDTVALWKALPGTPENPTAPTVPGWLHTYPAPPWLYSYKVPTDYIYARSVIAQPDLSTFTPPIFSAQVGSISQPTAPRVPFAIAVDPWDLTGVVPVTPPNIVILTNVQSPLFEYTYSNIYEASYDSEFVMVLVFALAARLAVPLTSDRGLAQLKMQSANAMIEEARARDGNEGLTVHDHIPDWLQVRGVAGSMYPAWNFWYPYGPLFSMAPFT